MPRDIRTYLHDVLVAGGLIRRFVSGRSLADYEDDPMLRSAVERQFEVIGEALRRAVETNPDLREKIPQLARIIAFRNQLIHGYTGVRHEIVWAIVEENLPRLLQIVDELMTDLGREG